MNIGQAAKASGVSAKMIRHYEAIQLIKPGKRNHSGYRCYAETDLHTLRFIKRGRSLGFSLEQIKHLLSLWENQSRASADVKELAMTHVDALNQKIAELSEMRDLLLQLAQSCNGDQRPDCPILGELGGGEDLAIRDEAARKPK